MTFVGGVFCFHGDYETEFLVWEVAKIFYCSAWEFRAGRTLVIFLLVRKEMIILSLEWKLVLPTVKAAGEMAKFASVHFLMKIQ